MWCISHILSLKTSCQRFPGSLCTFNLSFFTAKQSFSSIQTSPCQLVSYLNLSHQHILLPWCCAISVWMDSLATRKKQSLSYHSCSGAGEMTLWVKCLLHKCEDLRTWVWIPAPVENLFAMHSYRAPALGGKKQERAHQPAIVTKLMTPGLVRDLSLKK